MEAALGSLVERSGAEEVLITMNTFDQDERLDSYRRLARLAHPARRIPRGHRSGGSAGGDSVDGDPVDGDSVDGGSG